MDEYSLYNPIWPTSSCKSTGKKKTLREEPLAPIHSRAWILHRCWICPLAWGSEYTKPSFPRYRCALRAVFQGAIYEEFFVVVRPYVSFTFPEQLKLAAKEDKPALAAAFCDFVCRL